MKPGPRSPGRLRTTPVAVAAVATVLLLPASVQSQPAFTAASVHLRAGPGRAYPVVALLPPGLQLTVEGCLPDYTWCDVVAGLNRGWVYAGNISFYYQGAYVPLLSYGAVIGIGVFPFVVGEYWGRHYRHRPWYGDRYRWERREHDRAYAPRHRAPVPPQPVPAPGFAPRPPRAPAPLVQPPQAPAPRWVPVPRHGPRQAPRVQQPAPPGPPSVVPAPQQPAAPGAAGPRRPPGRGGERAQRPGVAPGEGPPGWQRHGNR